MKNATYTDPQQGESKTYSYYSLKDMEDYVVSHKSIPNSVITLDKIGKVTVFDWVNFLQKVIID